MCSRCKTRAATIKELNTGLRFGKGVVVEIVADRRFQSLVKTLIAQASLVCAVNLQAGRSRKDRGQSSDAVVVRATKQG